MKSFYEWCIEHDRIDFINMWSSYNKYTPYELPFWSEKKIMFEYNGNYHLYILNNLTHRNPEKLSKIQFDNKDRIKTKKTKKRIKYKKEFDNNSNNKNYKANNPRQGFKKSFYDWCIENNRTDILDRWDYELNEYSPKDYSSTSRCEIYLKCPNFLHESELFVIMSLTNMNIKAKCRKCNSFGQWLVNIYGDDAINNYWDYDKNIVNPFDIQIGYKKQKIYLKNYNGKKTSSNYPIDYIKNYERLKDNIGKTNREKQKKNSIRIYIKDVCPNIEEIWSNKNTVPFEDVYVSYVDSIIYWKCDNNIHDDYPRGVKSSLNSNFKCPFCSRENGISSYQLKTENYLNDNYNYTILHENDCSIIPINPKTNHKLPFDNEIYELKLIIEVNGRQHYDITSFAKSTAYHNNIDPECVLQYQKWKDDYKKNFALENGYSYLELPYWVFNDDTYKHLIDNKISTLTLESAKDSFFIVNK